MSLQRCASLPVVCVLVGLLASAARAEFVPSKAHQEIERLARQDVYALRIDSLQNLMRARRHFEQRIQSTLKPGRAAENMRKYYQRQIDEINKRIEAESARVGLSGRGYEILDVVHNSRGLQAVVLRDKSGQTHIVFRGTEGDKGPTSLEFWKDIIADGIGSSQQLADFFEQSIGELQYNYSKDLLDEWARKYPDSIVSGQSLGASLAQIFIARHPLVVKEGVVFNPPGVRSEIVDEYTKIIDEYLANGGVKGGPFVTGYHTLGDWIPNFGGESHILTKIIGVSGGNVAPEANVDVGPIPSGSIGSRLFNSIAQGLQQHRGWQLSGGPAADGKLLPRNTTLTELDLEWSKKRPGSKYPQINNEAIIEFSKQLFETLTPSGQQAFLDYLREVQEQLFIKVVMPDSIHEIITEWVLYGGDEGADRRAIELAILLADIEEVVKPLLRPGPPTVVATRPSSIPTPAPKPVPTPGPESSSGNTPRPQPTVTAKPKPVPAPTPAPKPTPSATPQPTPSPKPTPKPTPGIKRPPGWLEGVGSR